jgi:7-cyano-7-deazaguanine synthase
MSKAIVILSGGQDSVTCLYWALRNFHEVEAISFSYGQNHRVELECAKVLCEKEGIKHIIASIDVLPQLVESALVNNGDVNKLNEKGLPASFVPNRNALFLTLAHAYAQKVKATSLITGVCQTDFSGYPDCRRAFIDAMEWSLNMGSQSQIEIATPLMYINKAQTFAMADDLGKLKEVVELSHTCYNGDREHLHEWGYGCGECPACQLRAKGYNEFKNSK